MSASYMNMVYLVIGCALHTLSTHFIHVFFAKRIAQAVITLDDGTIIFTNAAAKNFQIFRVLSNINMLAQLSAPVAAVVIWYFEVLDGALLCIVVPVCFGLTIRAVSMWLSFTSPSFFAKMFSLFQEDRSKWK